MRKIFQTHRILAHGLTHCGTDDGWNSLSVTQAECGIVLGKESCNFLRINEVWFQIPLMRVAFRLDVVNMVRCMYVNSKLQSLN